MLRHPAAILVFVVIYLFILLFPFLGISIHEEVDFALNTFSALTWGISAVVLGVVLFVILRKYQTQ